MRKLRVWIGLAVAVALSIILFSSCTQPEKSNEIKIGAIAPLTGDNAVYGVAIQKGIQLGVDKINSTNGINGKKLNVIFEDDQADPQKSVAAYRKLTSVDKVPLILGGVFSASTLAIAPIAEKDKVVLLSPTSSAVELTKAGDFTFRIYPSDSYDGTFLADFASQKLRAKTASVLYVKVAAATALANVFKDKFEASGGKVDNLIGYNQGDTDFKLQITKIKDSNPDIVFMPGYLREMAIQLKQVKELGLNKPIIAPSSFNDPEIIKLAGNAAEGVMFSSPLFDPESKEPKIKMFVNDFSKKHNEKPNIWAAYGYDAVNIAALAMTKGDIKSEVIRDNLYKITNFLGVTGNTSFDSNGDVNKELKILMVSKQSFLPYSSKTN
jgi:branched-chain amino acid transport system substrate-binding protein